MPGLLPVLCHGPALWSFPSGSGGGSPCMLCHSRLLHHPPLTGISVFLQSRLLSPSGLPDVDLAAAACDTIYTLDCLPRGNVSLILVNIELRVHLDLKTTLMLNFLQTYLHSSQPHRVSQPVVPSPPPVPRHSCSCLLFPVWMGQKHCG